MNYNIQVDEDGFDIIPGSPKNITKPDSNHKDKNNAFMPDWWCLALDAAVMCVLFFVVFNLLHFWNVMNRPYDEPVSKELYDKSFFWCLLPACVMFWALVHYAIIKIRKDFDIDEFDKSNKTHILAVIFNSLIVLCFGALSGFLWSMNSEIYVDVFRWPCSISFFGALFFVSHCFGADR